MSHADEGTLHAYLDGELSPVERASLEVHLGECGACRARLDEARALIAGAQRLLGHAAPPETAVPPFRRGGGGALGRPLPRWVPLAWAATVLLALGGGWLARGGPARPAERAMADLLEQDAPVAPMAGGRDAAPAASQPANRAVVPLGETEAGRVAADDRSAKLEAKASAREEPAATPSAAPAEVVTAADAVVPTAPSARRPSAQEAAAQGALASGVAANADEARGATLDRDAARGRLGTDAVAIAGVPVLAIRAAGDGAVVVEQRLGAGVVVHLTERRVAPDAAERAREGQRAMQYRRDASERLARYVGTLRVEIEGSLDADSLSRLLERLTPIP